MSGIWNMLGRSQSTCNVNNTDDSDEARRERNKVSARMCRKRRKEREEDLQKQAQRLYYENAALKTFVAKLSRKIKVYEDRLPPNLWINDDGLPMYAPTSKEDESGPSTFCAFAQVNVSITTRVPNTQHIKLAPKERSLSDQFVASVLN